MPRGGGDFSPPPTRGRLGLSILTQRSLVEIQLNLFKELFFKIKR